MDNAIPDRYEKQPMLVIVENYVLDTLGLLEPDKAARLNDIVCRTFGGKNWRDTVRKEFRLGDDEGLRQLWKQQLEEAEAAQVELAPDQFARDVADSIFEGIGTGGDEDAP
jgi:hypothetical protein